MRNVELTTKGLKLLRDENGIHWLHLGPNAAFCVENLSHSEITTEQVQIWARVSGSIEGFTVTKEDQLKCIEHNLDAFKKMVLASLCRQETDCPRQSYVSMVLQLS